MLEWKNFNGMPYNKKFSLRIINKIYSNSGDYHKVLQKLTLIGWADIEKVSYDEIEELKTFANFFFGEQ